MIKAIIFDKDGVITDSEDFNYLVTKTVMNQFGSGVSHKNFIEKCTIGKQSAFETFRPANLDHDTYHKAKKKAFVEIFDKNRLISGVKELLESVKPNYKIALATGNDRYTTEYELDHFRIKHYFESIICIGDVKKNKPDPEMFLLSAKNLDIKPEECLVIEDTYVGLVAAKKAGMRCFVLKNKYLGHHDFSEADMFMDSLSQITIESIQKLG